MGSGERKRCSNIAPVRKLRNLAWIKARRFPGVLCSTLNTECRSLLCLMIIPGRSWVAGIDIGRALSLYDCGTAPAEGGQAKSSAATKAKTLFYTELRRKRTLPASGTHRTQTNTRRPFESHGCCGRGLE